MKYIKTIADLMERAEKKGYAVKRARQRGYWGTGDLEEVYRVENDGKTVSLFHYGTLTASVDLESLELLKIYGESRSDADSVNTFLSWLGFEGFPFGFRPVNGGFYLMTWKDGKRENVFLDDNGEDAILKAFNRVQQIKRRY